MTPALVIPMMIFSIPIIIILTRFYLKLQKMKIEAEQGGTGTDLKLKVGELVEENEEMKERLKNLEYLLLDKGEDRINIKQYDEDKIKLDNNEKWKF